MLLPCSGHRLIQIHSLAAGEVSEAPPGARSVDPESLVAVAEAAYGSRRNAIPSSAMAVPPQPLSRRPRPTSRAPAASDEARSTLPTFGT